MTFDETGRTAAQSHAAALLCVHTCDAFSDEEIIAGATSEYDGPVAVGAPGLTFTVYE